MGFFSGDMGFMYQEGFLQKFLRGIPAPRFRITIAKAFELVALFGPTLYWNNPAREVTPSDGLDLPADLFAGNPQGEQMQQMLMQMQQQDRTQKDLTSQLLSLYLNYTPGEQPQGLAWHASKAITEALVKGRGCLWPMPYKCPGTERTLTGCFYDSVDNLLIDPDATTLHDAKWIAQKVTKPVFEVEREYNLPEGTLSGDHSSIAQARGERGEPEMGGRGGDGQSKSFDMITYYKIWSKGGVGGRLSGPIKWQSEVMQAFDKVVGDYAHIAVSANNPFPLNAHSEWVRSASDNDIKVRLGWPVPYWLDNRWPVTVLDFYEKPGSPWPIAPLAPGLGELTFMNVIMSSLANHVYQSHRLLLATKRSLNPMTKHALQAGSDFEIVDLDEFEGSISDNVDFIQFPNMTTDVWQMLERTSYNFDRRTGITELMAGLNPGNKVARVAADVDARRQQMSVRPEYMASQVEHMLSEASDMEKICAALFTRPEDLKGVLGPAELYLWNQHVTNVPTELVMREVRAKVVANSARRPDKNRQVENANAAIQYFSNLFAQAGFNTGNWQPMNGLIKTWADAADMEYQDMLIDNQPTDPQQAEQERMAQEQAMMQQQAEMQAKQMEMQMKQQQQQLQLSTLQAKAQLSQQSHQQQLEQSQQKHLLGMAQSQQKMLIDQERFEQSFEHQDESHNQDIAHGEESHEQQLLIDAQNAALKQRQSVGTGES